MPKTEIVYARLSLPSYATAFRLEDTKYEINERLYQVLSEEFYTEPLTKELIRLNPEIFADYVAYHDPKTRLSTTAPEKIQAVGKFEVTGEKVQLLDIRFN